MDISSQLCKDAGIEFLNRIVTMDSWFENMRCVELLKTLLLNYLGILNTGKVGTPKDDPTKLLESNTSPRGTHVVYRRTNDEGETYFVVSWKVKSNLVSYIRINFLALFKSLNILLIRE